MTTLRFQLMLLAGLGLMPASARADPMSDKKPHVQAQSTYAPREAITGDAFSDTEWRLICDYFGVVACGSATLLSTHKGKPKGAISSKEKTALPPPGLGKPDDVPPGMERQFQRNGKLPPGQQKRQLPDDLSHTLPRHADGVERLIIGDDVLLVQTATGTILDILEGVAARR
ncbi:MAG: hypothetical protein EXR08_12650 [Alphaproteobacteria bacterium]|nr:hypothetical protein [Alphaproteobacteria bacterium]